MNIKGYRYAEKDEVTVDQLAEELGVDPRTIRSWIKKGTLPKVRRAPTPKGRGAFRIRFGDVPEEILDWYRKPAPKLELPTRRSDPFS